MNGTASRTLYATAADPECGPPGTRLLTAIRSEIEAASMRQEPDAHGKTGTAGAAERPEPDARGEARTATAAGCESPAGRAKAEATATAEREEPDARAETEAAAAVERQESDGRGETRTAATAEREEPDASGETGTAGAAERPVPDGRTEARTAAAVEREEPDASGGTGATATAAPVVRAGAVVASGPGREGSAVLVAGVSAWSRLAAERFRALLGGCGSDGSRDALVRRAALECAPLALVAGAWLQGLSSPAGAEDPALLRLLARYAEDVGVGRPAAGRGSAYLALLRALEVAEYASSAPGLAHDRRIPDDAFALPARLLTMSRAPEEFHDELLGADACLRAVGLLPPLALVREARPGAEWGRIDLTATGEHAGDVVQDRFAAGFRWVFGALRDWVDGLYERLDDARDPAHDMAELLRLRAREAAVYHHDFALEGRPLADWLAQSRTDPGPLLGALARSRLVRPGRSAASPLVNGLVGERGAMFRVFAPEELTVIRRWIDSLPADHATGGAPTRARRPGPTPELPAWRSPGDEQGREPKDLREAYRLLGTRTDTPALSDWAARYARDWLDRARRSVDGGAYRLPDTWPDEGLRPWLSEQHERHAEEFTAGQDAPLPSREVLVESTVQLAPLTMIDGAWLHGFTDYALAAAEPGFALFETYWDELGNGEPGLNHPRIYRELLAEMGAEPPPGGSAEFAAWPRFAEESFALPVFWLAVGRFPRTLQPEILGLNLAMELSGVGGSYRRARLALRRHGFSTRFVDIHNTIDNVAGGHAAWACDAVDSHLAALPGGRSGAREAAWARVRSGFRSLSLDPGRAGSPARRLVRRWRRTAHA
ncbi:iron-containing redox enzyme family protein [Streptomyces sp. NPDC056948]|uniref:iron-containing redox enzyme family protein n=1 Tax=Streptomyces sp. NPDC056948 TaxID=3345975 RepID=UPI003624C944